MTARVFKTESGGRRELTELISSVNWSGDYQSAVRELDIKLLSDPMGRFPGVKIEAGDIITAQLGSKTFFAGQAVSISRQSEFGEIDVRCHDRGRILKRNKTTYQFKNTTPEEAVSRIASDFGIELGDVAQTGVKLTRNFVTVDLYSVILTMYTLASEQNGKKYIVRFDAEKLCVLEKVKPLPAVRIETGRNLMDLSVTENIENLVNCVQIYDKTNKVISESSDAESIAKYGSYQEMIKTSDTAEQQAKKLLADKGPMQKITVNTLGDIRCITGTVVELLEPHTGLVGEFYIDSDVHTWKRGQYYNKLTLNFKNIMSERSY